MSGKGEVGFRFHWKDGQLFIIQLNGQCFGFHRLPGHLPHQSHQKYQTVVCRDNIRQCEQAGLPLDAFLALSIAAMRDCFSQPA